MERTASNLISIARGELGYLEKASNKSLNSKTANAGSANYSKYGAWYGINPGAWCAMFVSWCFGVLTGSRAAAAEMLCGYLWASCTKMYGAFKAAGRVYSSPEPGDIVVFRQAPGSSTMVHTCIVTEVKGGRIYTIEGNTSSASGVVANGGGVAAKSYPLGNNRIGGYLRPYYAAETNSKVPTELVSVQTYLLKRGHTGETVKALQYALNARGYDSGEVDGEFGPKTENALKLYQSGHKLEADGECGRLTWSALCGGKS